MRISWLLVIFLTLASLTRLQAWEQPTPATEPPMTVSAASPDQAAKPAEAGPAVDAAKVTGSTFESQYFKFTYELPKNWKALNDAVRIASNHQALQEDTERPGTPIPVPKKASSRPPVGKGASVGTPPSVSPERYNLMAASPNGLDSLASPALPRINIWAHRRFPPLDKAMDHAQLLIEGKHATVLVQPMEVTYYEHTFARVEVIDPAGNYQARYITIVGDYLLGFDFLAESERELAEISNTIKTVRFQ
jgi:hypothetical protein